MTHVVHLPHQNQALDVSIHEALLEIRKQWPVKK